MTKDTQDENEGISKIMDGIIHQVSKTRKTFIILIALVALPLAGIILMTAVSFIMINLEIDNVVVREEVAEDAWILDLVLAITIGFSALMAFVLVYGIKQLVSLKQWTKKYEKFQAKLDEFDRKLDEELEK